MSERRYTFGAGGRGSNSAAGEAAAPVEECRNHRSQSPISDEVPRDRVTLPDPRIQPPSALVSIASTDAHDRAAHTYGKSFPDYVRAFDHDFKCAPDLVMWPRNERDVVAVLDWASDANVAVIPFGGGSSVVGGVEPTVGERFAGTVSMDLRKLNRVTDVNVVARAARIEAGALGPVLERQLKPHNLTLRHFPQSFEFSTLGGWIATRSGGHFATRQTHIEDPIESLRLVSPRGTWNPSPARVGSRAQPRSLFLDRRGPSASLHCVDRVVPRPVIDEAPPCGSTVPDAANAAREWFRLACGRRIAA